MVGQPKDEHGDEVDGRLAGWVQDLPTLRRARHLLLPVAVGTTVLTASAYSDENLRVDTAPLAALWVAVAVAVPGTFLLAFVRIKMLWLVAIVVLTLTCVVAPVATALSEDAQAGLAMLLIPYVGGIAALVAASGEALLRWRRRSHRRRQRTT
jgi:hypothetical protein